MKTRRNPNYRSTLTWQPASHKIMGYIIVCTVFLMTFHGAANASDLIDTSEGDTAYFFTNYGLNTYKSKLVAGNDTGTSLTYGIGAHAGADKQLGFEHRVESQTTNIALTSSSISSVWTSTILKYRLSMFELGAVIGGAKVIAKRDSAEILNMTGSGYGGYVGFIFPVGKKNLMYLNAMSVATAKPVDTTARVIALGSRTDIDFGGRISILRHGLDATVGYRRRSNSITEGGTAFAELQTATYLGIQSGFDF